MKRRFWVGYRKGDYKMIQFVSLTTPTPDSHPEYSAVIGPFLTKRGALFMAEYGDNNPHCITVQDAERLGKKYSKRSD